MNTINTIQAQIELLGECQNKLAQAKTCYERALGKERVVPDSIHDLMRHVGDRIDVLNMDLEELLAK
jgi:hypothetical protein